MVSDCSAAMIGSQRPLGEGGTGAAIFETNDGALAVDDEQRALAMWRTVSPRWMAICWICGAGGEEAANGVAWKLFD